MSKKYLSYPAEYRQQMVEVLCGGRRSGESAREFECSETAIRGRIAR